MKASFAGFHRHQLEHQGLHEAVPRREAIKLGAAAAAAAVAAGTVGVGSAGAQGNSGGGNGQPSKYGPPSGTYGDDMFDVDDVLAGAWDVGPYGPGDQRGTFNELTPERTAAALRVLNSGQPVNTYQLGEEMFNGFPAFPSDPPRTHDMFLYVLGYEPPPGFVSGGGILSGTDPIGQNLVSAHEERFNENFTFQIATQIDGLNHIGLGEIYYNGFHGPAIATPTGTTALGNETMGPVTTRGVIYDVIGLKVAQGATDSFFVAPNGAPVLNDNYRITLDDLRACLERQRVDEVGPGDVPIMRTGWNQLTTDDPTRYLTQQPGIYLDEARYFADRRVALVAADTWGLEVLDPAVTEGNAFPVHQELIIKNGVRIGESFIVDAAVADNCFEGVLVATPENVPGATCGSSPPCFMAQPGRAPR